MSLLRALFGRTQAASLQAVTAPAPAVVTADTWRSAGNEAIATGDPMEAARCYREASMADPRDPLARLNLGFVLWRQGQASEAETCLVHALALTRHGDDFAHDAHYLLGQIHRQRGAREQALIDFRAASAARPAFAEAIEDEANVLIDLSRNEEALDVARRLVGVRPGAASKAIEGRALYALGRHDEALQAIDAALAQEPTDTATLAGRGHVLLALARSAEALVCFEDVVARVGEDADGLTNVAAALNALGRFGEARERIAVALKLQPAHPPALLNDVQALHGLLLASGADARLHAALAAAHRELGELPQALKSAEMAVALDSALGTGHLERARVFGKLGRNEEALTACLRATELQPDAGALETLTALYARQRMSEEALEASVRAVAADPGDLAARSRELFLSNFSEPTNAEALFERHLAYARLLEARIAPTHEGRWLGSRESGRRLRIGFVSSDLYNHPVVLFLIPLLARIDHARFEVVCYSTGRNVDETTAQIRSMVSDFVEAALLTDSQLAARIHEDAIDVLVDLSGHSGTPRLAAFAERPAPVQMTWLGYLNTTGLSRIDYRLCDERSDPAATQQLNTERLLPFAQSQWCYRPFVQTDPEPVAPCVRNGVVTFGSFNNARKISGAMCGRWAEVLARCPGSRLMVADITSSHKRQALLDAFAAHGVQADRLELVPRTDIAGYLRLYDRVDISLDTYPYGGGTTTIDSLWMGVPVVTASGDLPVSRSASSILQLLGLDAWVAPSIDGYVDCVVRHAQDMQAIQRLRTSLRTRVRASPLMDEAGFAKSFEAALRGAWQRFCAGAQAS